jgi:hypothetical protein
MSGGPDAAQASLRQRRPAAGCRGPAALRNIHPPALLCLLRHAVPAVQVIRSRDRLLDQLYNYLMALKPYEIENLMAEDPTLVKR